MDAADERMVGAQIVGAEGVLVTDHLVLDPSSGYGTRLTMLLTRILPPAAIFVLVLLAWQFLVPAFGLKSYQLPVPTVIWQAFRDNQSVLITDGWFTFWDEAFRGYVIGSALGLALAVAAWRFSPLAHGIMPYAVISSALPIVGLAPALDPIAGSDWQSKVWICTIMTVFPMAVGTYRGLCSVDPAARDLITSYAAGGWISFLKLNLPASLPYVFNALKINTTLAVIGAIVAEYFGSPINGLGLFIDNASGVDQYPALWAGVLVACVIGIIFYGIILILERRLTSWHVSFR